MSVLSPVCFLSNSAWKEKALNTDTLLNVNVSVVNSGGSFDGLTVETVATPFEKSVLPIDVTSTTIEGYPATTPVTWLQLLQPVSKFKSGVVMAGGVSRTKAACAGVIETAAIDMNAAASISRVSIIADTPNGH